MSKPQAFLHLYAYNFWKCADAITQNVKIIKISPCHYSISLVHAWRNSSLWTLVHFHRTKPQAFFTFIFAVLLHFCSCNVVHDIYGVHSPHNFWGAPVAQPATTKFGTKVVIATYYRSDCNNNLYYRTSHDHGLYGSTSCCIISQYPVHYPVKFDADIFSQSELLTFFFSHNLKIQNGGSRHLGFSGYVNWPFPCADSVVFVFCAKFSSNICYSHWDWCT